VADNDAPFQPLPARLAGLPIDDTLHDDVPAWLAEPLREWLVGAVDNDEELARRILIRLRWAPAEPGASYVASLLLCDAAALLTVIDAVLQLSASLWQYVEFLRARPDIRRSDPVKELNGILTDGASRYTVDVDGRRLVVRLDPTVTSAAKTATAADPTAGDHLRAAWGAAYGLHPDPDKAYAEAVKAVEAASCTLVLPENGNATLGTVRAHLRDAPTKWELVLPGKDGNAGSVTPVVEMLTALWDGQRSRHAGTASSRRQTQAEVEAAVHLAATLIQWLTTGVLRRRTL
jgi:hypothetical protein